MATMKFPVLSSARLPADHLVSGALIGGMGAAAVGIKMYANGETSAANTLKRIAKFSLSGGIAAATAISASNSIARREYTNALTKITLGIGGLLLIESLLKENNE